MLPGQLIDARGRPPAEHGREEGGPVARQQPLVNLLQWVRQPTEPPPNSADDPSIEPTAPVWCRDEDQPSDLGLGLEEHHLTQQAAVLGRADELFEQLGAAELPEIRPTILGHHLGQQPPHAVADEDHVFKGGVRAIGVEPAPRRAQILPQQVGRIEDRSARRVIEGPELVALAQRWIDLQRLDHRSPRLWAGSESVDEDDGDLPPGVGSGRREPGWPVRLSITPGWSRSEGRNQGEHRDHYQVDSGAHGLGTPWARTAFLPRTTISAVTIRGPQQTAAASTGTRLVPPR